MGNQRMTRDQRRDVLLMRRLGYQFESIARFIGTTISSCHYTCRRGTPETNHKNGGRRVHFPPEVVSRMVEYVKEYQAKEKIAGRDKKTGKKKMPMLNWTMIRQNCLADANGQIPKELKFTDDAMKKMLNKHGIFLRKPMSEEMREIGRLRGKKQWLDKLVKDRAEAAKKAAEAQAAGRPVSAELAALASGAMVPDGHGSDMDEGSDGIGEDAEMGDGVYSETDETPADSEEDDDDDAGDGGGHVEPMQIEDQLRQAIAAPGNYR